MTTTATMNVATDKFPVSLDWDIKIVKTNDPDVKKLNRLLILNFTNHDSDPDNQYTVFEGEIFDDSLPTSHTPIFGIYTTDVITFHFYKLTNITDIYVFTGLCEDAFTITNGSIYKDDPTDDGSWSGTAQPA